MQTIDKKYKDLLIEMTVLRGEMNNSMFFDKCSDSEKYLISAEIIKIKRLEELRNSIGNTNGRLDDIVDSLGYING